LVIGVGVLLALSTAVVALWRASRRRALLAAAGSNPRDGTVKP
jgi:hypothetical protein